MHSSRMRTGRLLTVCGRLLPGGGGVSLIGEGGAWSGGVCLVRGVSALGVSLVGGGGVSAPGGCVPGGGICSWGAWSGGGLASQHALRQTPSPPVDRITDACKRL